MKFVRLKLAIFVCSSALHCAWPTPASPQDQQPALAEVARRAREQRQHAPKAARVWTNDNLPTTPGAAVSVVGLAAEPVAPEESQPAGPLAKAAASEEKAKERKETEKRAWMVAAVAATSVSLGAGRAAAQGPQGAGAGEAGTLALPWPFSEASPLLGGYVLFTTTYRPGQFSQVGTVLTPVLLVPFGNKWLIETKFVLDGEYKRDANSKQWDQTLGRNFEFIQLDYLASRYLTLIAGRFLTPFGIFNERQHAPWIKKLQIQPFIATGAPSGNGGMLKGAFQIGSNMQLNYAAYFSALTTVETIETRRTTGHRFGFALPNHRLEFGTSFQRVLHAGNSNSFGFDATWLPLGFPLELRAEFTSSMAGDGYWVEGGYRFSRKNEAVVRMEEFFVPAGFNKPVNPGPGGNLPIVSTRRPMMGWNHYFRDGLKFSLSYGRELTARGDRNVWNVALAYRFQ